MQKLCARARHYHNHTWMRPPSLSAAQNRNETETSRNYDVHSGNTLAVQPPVSRKKGGQQKLTVKIGSFRRGNVADDLSAHDIMSGSVISARFLAAVAVSARLLLRSHPSPACAMCVCLRACAGQPKKCVSHFTFRSSCALAASIYGTIKSGEILFVCRADANLNVNTIGPQ